MSRMPTTRWSLVLKAAGNDPEVARRAVATICELYREPVRCFFLFACRDDSRADDLTQGLMTSLIERGDFGRPERSMGRFRNYLIGAAKHYLFNDGRAR